MDFKSEKVDVLAGVTGECVADKTFSPGSSGFFNGRKTVEEKDVGVGFIDLDEDFNFKSDKYFADFKAGAGSAEADLIELVNVRSLEGYESNQTNIKVEPQSTSGFIGHGSHESTAVVSNHVDDSLPSLSIKTKVLVPSSLPSCSAGCSRESERLAEGISSQQSEINNMACEMVDKGTNAPRGRKNKDHVRRPPNCFMVFRKYTIRNAGDTIATQQHMSMECGSLWRALGADQKDMFKHASDVALDYHKSKHPNYQYAPRRKKRRSQEKIKSCENKNIESKSSIKLDKVFSIQTPSSYMAITFFQNL